MCMEALVALYPYAIKNHQWMRVFCMPWADSLWHKRAKPRHSSTNERGPGWWEKWKVVSFYLGSLTLQYPQDQLIVFHIIALCRLATEQLFISSQRKNCHSGKKIECENEYVEDCNDTKHGYKGFTRRCEGVPLRKVLTSPRQIFNFEKILFKITKYLLRVRHWEEGFQPFYTENVMKCQQKTARQFRSGVKTNGQILKK